MNKKGFTLVELLAVITIISLITLIALPHITSEIRNKKTEISETNRKLLAAAADLYIQDNPLLYEYGYEADGSTYCIEIQSLIDNELIQTPFKNENGEEIDYTYKVKATYQAQYNNFDYQVVANCTEVKQYVSRPELAKNMIPVKYDENLNSWVKVDKDSKWYNYSEQQWANAVLVNETASNQTGSKSRYEYTEAPIGTEILESDILAYFVWIPRFRYQIFDDETETINIIFEKQNTQKSTGATYAQWLTHPAFTYNNKELSGIWVGKYASSSSNDDTIIRNQASAKNISYETANIKAVQMVDYNNIYGLQNINTHMMRNSEWGAVAYLANSKYGNAGNNSTTNNITGIYNLGNEKEFVIRDNASENSLGYALNETKEWATSTSYVTNENPYLIRGNESIYNYENSAGTAAADTTFRVTLINEDVQNEQYENNPNAHYDTRTITVTFDANGGTVSQSTKEVSYQETYGDLPTPTRPGYIFKGWNGKNLFNSELELGSLSNTTGEIQNNGTNCIRSADFTPIKSNTVYTMSNDMEYATYIYEYDTDKVFIRYIANQNDTNTFTTQNNTKYIKVRSRFTEVQNNLNAKYQLEESTEATPYEPYYITSQTTVVQNENHTLKAVWEPVNYGSSIESSYSTLYYSLNSGPKTTVDSTITGTWRGNYTGTYAILDMVIDNGSRITNSGLSNHSSVVVSSGSNTVNFTSQQSNKWVCLTWHWGSWSGTQQLSNINLLFNNNQSYTLADAVSNNYIEPLVPYISADRSRDNNMSYVLENPEQLVTGGSQTKAYSEFHTCIKVKNVSPLKGVSFTTAGNWDTSYNDGFDAYASDTIEFSK